MSNQRNINEEFTLQDVKSFHEAYFAYLAGHGYAYVDDHLGRMMNAAKRMFEHSSEEIKDGVLIIRHPKAINYKGYSIFLENLQFNSEKNNLWVTLSAKDSNGKIFGPSNFPAALNKAGVNLPFPLFTDLPKDLQEAVSEQYSAEEDYSNFVCPWEKLSEQKINDLREFMHICKDNLISSIAKDEIYGKFTNGVYKEGNEKDLPAITVKIFNNFAPRTLLPDEVLLAFQLRHNKENIFGKDHVLSEIAQNTMGFKGSVEDLLNDRKRFSKFRSATGRTVNEVLEEATASKIMDIEYGNSMRKLRDLIDKTRENIYSMDVFEIEVVLKQIESEQKRLEGRVTNGLRRTDLERIDEIRGHLKRAKAELLKWHKRGYRTNNNTFDKLLGREFHPMYKLPEKALMQTKEGREYIKGLLKGNDLNVREKARYEEAQAKILMVYAFKKDSLLLEKEKGQKLFLERAQEKGRNLNLIEGRSPEDEFMRLAELKFNIQDGENRIVPGMSKRLIDASQRMTDVLVSKENENSIAPIGKNPAREARDERRRELNKKYDIGLGGFLNRQLKGYSSHKTSSSLKKGRD